MYHQTIFLILFDRKGLEDYKSCESFLAILQHIFHASCRRPLQYDHP